MSSVLTSQPGSTSATPQHAGTPLERARSLARLIKEHANSGDRQRTTLPDKVVAALAEAGLFWMAVPKEFGGDGLGIWETVEVIEEVTRADASTGWVLMATSLTLNAPPGYLPPAGIQAMFGGKERPICAGMAAAAGKGTRVPGGYRLRGRHRFASGIAHANWVTAGFEVVDESGSPVIEPNGVPETRLGWVPRERVRVDEASWEVTGLRRTGSYDYEVLEQFVPEEMTFSVSSLRPLRDEPIYALGVWGNATLGHVSIALGLMKSALEEIAVVTKGKARGFYPTTVDKYPLFLSEFSKHEAMYQAARSLVMDTYARLDATVLAGKRLSEEQEARLRHVPVWATQVAADVMRFCHQWGATQAIKCPSRLATVSLDTAVATQHLLVDTIAMVDVGTPLLDFWVHAAEQDMR